MEVDQLAQEAGFERGYEYLGHQLELSKISSATDLRRIAEKKLLEDEQFKKLTTELQEIKQTLGKEKTLLFTERGKREVLIKRRQKVRTIRDYFQLSDSDIRNITKKDIRLMGEKEFDNFIDDLGIKAQKLSERRQLANELN